MFSDEDYKRAIGDFVAYLRTITSQKNLAFFSDVSREYIRSLGKGEGIPTVKVFFSMIDAAGLDIIEGTRRYLSFLEESHKLQAAEKSAAINYVRTAKIEGSGSPRKKFR